MRALSRLLTVSSRGGDGGREEDVHVSSGVSSYKDTDPVGSGSHFYDRILP